jgi:hypothetical protein
VGLFFKYFVEVSVHSEENKVRPDGGSAVEMMTHS